MGRQIKYGHLLHGGDYNPEQWLDRPDILEKDIEYFKKAKINTVSVGMFSWAMLEPEEGNYQFDWLEKVIDSLYAEGISTILSTPNRFFSLFSFTRSTSGYLSESHFGLAPDGVDKIVEIPSACE